MSKLPKEIKKILNNKEWLENEYKIKTCKEISKEMGIKYSQVKYHLEKHGIKNTKTKIKVDTEILNLKRDENCIRTGLIYVIKNTINDRVYVGQTSRTMETRFKQHLYDSDKLNTKLYYAMRKHGKENFYIELLEDNINLTKIDEKEIYYINKLNSFTEGYNSTLGGEGGKIFLDSDEKIELFKEMFYEGYSHRIIGENFGVTRLTVLNTVKSLGLKRGGKIVKKSKARLVSETMSREFFEELTNYYSIKQISVITGLSKNSLNNLYNHYDLPKLSTRIIITNYILEFSKYMTVKEMEKHMNYPHSAIYSILRENNITPKVHESYSKILSILNELEADYIKDLALYYDREQLQVILNVSHVSMNKIIKKFKIKKQNIMTKPQLKFKELTETITKELLENEIKGSKNKKELIEKLNITERKFKQLVEYYKLEDVKFKKSEKPIKVNKAKEKLEQIANRVSREQILETFKNTKNIKHAIKKLNVTGYYFNLLLGYYDISKEELYCQ